MSAVQDVRSENDPDELRRVAEQLAADAAEFVRRRRTEITGEAAQTPAVLRSKSSPTDPVTIADTDTERFVRQRLAQCRPGEPILGEELTDGQGTDREGRVRWVVDPIDGTVNFVYGIPAYAVSVAAQIDGVSVAGAVADVCSGEVYSAAAGRGASVSGGVAGAAGRVPLRCTSADELSMALIGTGFGYQTARRAAQAALLADLLPLVRDVRRIGSAALDLCAVAAGRLDAHYEHGLNVWDWAAGALIAAEAGAVVVLPDGPAGLLVAAAPGVAAELIAALQRLAPRIP
ncbi:MAG: inositol monophosphatase [Mycobacterium sp.]|nr:inositol monophosphatase [Mycobacterium sp.]